MSCYFVYHGGTAELESTTAPCSSTANGAVAQCCGDDAYCLSDGVCGYIATASGGSGYYMAGCTDPSFKDPACPQNCTGFWNSDVVYNYGENFWQCCGNGPGDPEDGSLNCSSPAGKALSPVAPPPLELNYVAAIQSYTYIPLQPSVMPLNAAASSTPHTAPKAAASIAPETQGGGGLGVGAGIGIGLAAGLVVAALAWLLAVLIWRRQGYRLSTTPKYHYSGLGQEVTSPVQYQSVGTAEVAGTSKATGRVEIPG